MSSLPEVIEILIAAARFAAENAAKDRARSEPLVTSWNNYAGVLPDFDLRPRDFLGFAADELGKEAVVSRINCVNHLKRAIECQVDTYLFAWNMLDYVRGKKMPPPRGLPGKLELLKSLGLFGTRSVTRLNLMRNKMEHEYALPDIHDLDVFYELVETSIAVLERAVTIPHFAMVGIGNLRPERYVEVSYYFDKPSITFIVDDFRDGEFLPEVLCEVALEEDRDAFIQGFRILSLLGDTVIHLIDEHSFADKLERMIKENVR